MQTLIDTACLLLIVASVGTMIHVNILLRKKQDDEDKHKPA